MGYETDHKWSGSAAISGTCEAPCSLPDWHDAETKMHRGETLTALERLILDNEPANPIEADRFREQVAAVLREANARSEARAKQKQEGA